MDKNLKSIKPITYSGILIGLNIIFLYLSSILPTGKLFLLCLTTFTIMIILIEFSTYYALTAYVATSIIGLLIIPKPTTIAFIVMFGYYGIIKHYIEKVNNRVLEWILKYIYFNIIFISSIKIVTNFLLGENDFKYNIWYLLIIIEIGFFIYDYAMSIIVNYYTYRFRDKIFR